MKHNAAPPAYSDWAITIHRQMLPRTSCGVSGLISLACIAYDQLQKSIAPSTKTFSQ
jgi:hypothetical protein